MSSNGANTLEGTLKVLAEAGYSAHFESFLGVFIIHHDDFHVMADDYDGSLPADRADQYGWTVGVYHSPEAEEMVGSASIAGDASDAALLACLEEALREARQTRDTLQRELR